MFSLFQHKNASQSPSARIYLDYAAATPVAPAVLQAMLPYFTNQFGNPSAIHAEGQHARAVIEESRETVARTLGVQSAAVTFTSGGTESNNLAIIGVVAAAYSRGVAYADMEIITTKLEHPATLRTVEHLAAEGVVVHYVPVDAVGKIELSALTALVSAKTLLVTVAYVNSEIGTIQDLGAISRVIARVNREGGGHTLLHTDAAQAPLWLPCDLVRLGVDLLSLDAGKFCGPKGIGILVRRKGVVLQTITYGGGQEAGLRPGTENVPAVIGFAAALVLAQSDWLVRSTQIAARRDYFIAALTKAVPALVLNGGVTTDRVANNVNISIPGLDSEFAVVVLDIKGVAASTKSACSSAGGGESMVVKTISGDTVRATSTLRFTLGPDTTSAELDRAVLILADHLAATPVR